MSTIVNPTTDKAQVPTSEDIRTKLNIVDNAQADDIPGSYMTAYRRTGADWSMTVDYFEDMREWAVYARMGDDTAPLTRQVMLDFLAAHEDAQGISDHLNAHVITRQLNDAADTRQQFDLLFRGANGVEVTI